MVYLESKKPTLDCGECDLRRIGSYHGSDVPLCVYGKELKLLDETLNYHRRHCEIFSHRLRPARIWPDSEISAELIQIEAAESRREKRRGVISLQKQLF